MLLYQDLPLLVVGSLLLLGAMGYYCGSLSFAALALLQVLLAVPFAYGIFVLIFRFPFFPFLNLTGIYMCVGIGADGVFVFLNAYKHALRAPGRANTRHDVECVAVATTLAQAGASTLVTSLTTAGAFLAAAGSPIPSIACFGVFCCLIVLCDWLLMTTYLSALLVVQFRKRGAAAKPDHQQFRVLQSIIRLIVTQQRRATLCVVLLLCAGLLLGAQYISPGFPHPTTHEMQLLPDRSGIEAYCCVGPRVQLDFHQDSGKDSVHYVHLVFGSRMVDNGDGWDPEGYAPGELHERFDMTSVAAQVYLLNLCFQARAAPWYGAQPRQPWDSLPWTRHAHKRNNPCLIEALVDAAAEPCGRFQDMSDCCGISTRFFPYDPHDMHTCLGAFARQLSNTFIREDVWSDEEVLSGGPLRAGYREDELPGVWFDPAMSLPTPRIIKLSFATSMRTSTLAGDAYASVEHFYSTARNWSEPILLKAPPELAGGFFSPGDSLAQFAMQAAMVETAYQSIYISLGVAAAVLFFTIPNLVVCASVTVTVLLATGAATGCVILMGWQLGIIESIIVTCGVGMACDFATHVGFSFLELSLRHDPPTQSPGLIHSTASSTASPLSAAALSTAIMGTTMCFGGTIFMQRFGVFISLLVILSWTFAFFFLLPLLSLLGRAVPAGGFRPWRLVRTLVAVTALFVTFFLVLPLLAILKSAQKLSTILPCFLSPMSFASCSMGVLETHGFYLAGGRVQPGCSTEAADNITMPSIAERRVTCDGLHGDTHAACLVMFKSQKRERHMGRMRRCSWYAEPRITHRWLRRTSPHPETRPHACVVEEDNGSWLFVRIGPALTTGGYSWDTLFSNFNRSMLARWRRPDGSIWVSDHVLGSSDEFGELIGNPPLHQHHYHLYYENNVARMVLNNHGE